MSKFVVNVTWDDVPHLSAADKEELLASTEPHLRDARAKGIPHLSAGAVYPIPEDAFVEDDFAIPPHWPRAYALDVGWNKTAAVWGAHDTESDVWHLYSEHYMGKEEPVIHAKGIKARGDTLRGAIDPAAKGRSQKDGKQLLREYRQLGLHLTEADNTVEAGIHAVWVSLSAGQIKVFRSMVNWLAEFRLYRRNENGKIIKERDHLMDATRYFWMTGRKLAIRPQRIPEDRWERAFREQREGGANSWKTV